MNGETWLPEAREIAAQCWCDPETEKEVMNPALAEAVARRIAAWMDTVAQYGRNADFYRGLLDRIGRAVGEEAFIADDGTVQESPLRFKLPRLVEQLASKVAA